ncbi:MAG: hypothetical protein KFF77_02000 [Bacteroidetes bacterium]|nr:hypothetical protein [Bacteroidota bacterium]
MKKVLSYVAVLALAMSLTTVQAQDKPKAESKQAKTENCDSKARKSGCCDRSATKTKKMASKHECGDKCGDGCTMAHKTSTKQTETKKN